MLFTQELYFFVKALFTVLENVSEGLMKGQNRPIDVFSDLPALVWKTVSGSLKVNQVSTVGVLTLIDPFAH